MPTYLHLTVLFERQMKELRGTRLIQIQRTKPSESSNLRTSQRQIDYVFRLHIVGICYYNF